LEPPVKIGITDAVMVTTDCLWAGLYAV